MSALQTEAPPAGSPTISSYRGVTASRQQQPYSNPECYLPVCFGKSHEQWAKTEFGDHIRKQAPASGSGPPRQSTRHPAVSNGPIKDEQKAARATDTKSWFRRQSRATTSKHREQSHSEFKAQNGHTSKHREQSHNEFKAQNGHTSSFPQNKFHSVLGRRSGLSNSRRRKTQNALSIIPHLSKQRKKLSLENNLQQVKVNNK
ncbi:unnamed protein product [Clonostachys solani]|uniref:Uncharacterized protein n=1 Tax=Clonostachys solani TaxID=160281 RepID=A0A9N9ZB50_9HYPO|nr:unnamed protein product [Clonostachys solani]